MYDSTTQTRRHIKTIQGLLGTIANLIANRAEKHDESKLSSPEKDVFDEFHPKLASVVYDSPEYKRLLAEMGPGLEHHYSHNRHHPEHHPNGINDMTLIDLIEMLADWKASSRGQMNLTANFVRFKIDKQLAQIITRTMEELGW